MAPAKRYLPLGLDLRGIPCLVVGGGRIGTRKALTLIEARARVTVVAPEVSPVLLGKVAWIRAAYSRRHLAGHRLVVAATSDPKLNIRIGREAEALGAFSCVVSKGRSGRLIFPALARVGGLTVAVHSDGCDCEASRVARDIAAGALRVRR